MKLKDLEMNPTGYEIFFNAETEGQEKGLAVVSGNLSAEDANTGCLNSQEAQKIGEWFLKLAKELK